MAQFRATIKGQRGHASRLGGKNTGIFAWVNGWHSGVEVCGKYNEITKQDEFQIYKTGGSCGGHKVLIAEVSASEVKK